VDPRQWYPEANTEQKAALLRRMKITHFLGEWVPPSNDENISDEEVHWDSGNPLMLDDNVSDFEPNTQTLLDLLSGEF